jgi:hypothetical protein
VGAAHARSLFGAHAFVQVNVVGQPAGEQRLPPRAYHTVVVANLPRSAEHVNVVKPHSNSLELSLFDDLTRRAIRGRGTGGVDDPPVHYVSTVEMEEAARRPFDVALDGHVVSGVQTVRCVRADASAANPRA